MDLNLPPLEDEIEKLAEKARRGDTKTVDTRELDELLKRTNASQTTAPSQTNNTATASFLTPDQTWNYSLRNRTDLCDRVFERAKALGYYSDGERHTRYWLDINSNEPPPTGNVPPGTNYASLSPGQKNTVLAGLAQIVCGEMNQEQQRIQNEQNQIQRSKEEENKRGGERLGGIILMLMGIALGLTSYFYIKPPKPGEFNDRNLGFVASAFSTGFGALMYLNGKYKENK